MTNIMQKFVSDQEGATAIEYALLASMMALFLVNGLTALGSRLSAEFREVSAALK